MTECGVTTGRLSSANPNMSNTPKMHDSCVEREENTMLSDDQGYIVTFQSAVNEGIKAATDVDRAIEEIASVFKEVTASIQQIVHKDIQTQFQTTSKHGSFRFLECRNAENVEAYLDQWEDAGGGYVYEEYDAFVPERGLLANRTLFNVVFSSTGFPVSLTEFKEDEDNEIVCADVVELTHAISKLLQTPTVGRKLLALQTIAEK
ncbi:MAG: hypothetical protein DRJ03_24840 [Chloroflexi bacterium]|nr:MAG: hypothetical protein DRJ03_24840 [Chloroflexota bacterium]